MHGALSGFTSVDDLAEKFPYISGYAYSLWSPIMLVDKDGNKVDVALFDVSKTSKDATLVKAGKKIPSVPNAFQVLAHGNPNFMRNVVNGVKVEGNAGKINSAAAFDNAFSDNAEWNNGKNTSGFSLILYSCNTGSGDKSIASKISEEYDKINVIAPTKQGWFKDSGNGIIGLYGKNEDGAINKDDPGYWIVYQKGKAVEAYDATWVPGTSTDGHKVDLKDIPASHFSGETATKEFNKEKDK
jgi:hypothetical protein